MRTLFVAAILCLILTGAHSQTVDWTRPIKLHLETQSLVDAFERVFKQASVTYTIWPEARAFMSGTTVGANQDSITMQGAIELLVRIAGKHDGKQLNALFGEKRCVISVINAPKDAMRRAPPSDPSPGGRLIDYRAKDVTLLQAITEILDKLKTGYRIHPDVRKVLAGRRASPGFEQTSLNTAFFLLLRDLPPSQAINQWFEPDHAYYVFVPASRVSDRDVAAAKITLDVKDSPPAVAMRKLFESGGLNFAFSPEVLGKANVNASVSGMAVSESVQSVLKAAGLEGRATVEGGGGVFHIHPPINEPGIIKAERRVTAHFKDTDIRYALKAIFGAVGVDYTVDPHVAGTVTAECESLPFRDALELILKKAAGPLSLRCRVEDRVYNVSVNPDYEAWK